MTVNVVPINSLGATENIAGQDVTEGQGRLTVPEDRVNYQSLKDRVDGQSQKVRVDFMGSLA